MPERFHDRFDIDIDRGEARRRFMNRVYNDVFVGVIGQMGNNGEFHLTRYVASRMGELHQPYDKVAQYTEGDFLEVPTCP